MSGATVHPVDDGFLVVCPQHNLIRGVETAQHAANLEALHNRVDHADDTDSIEVDLTAAARNVLAVEELAPDQLWGALATWEALTGLRSADAIALARQLAAAEQPLIAAVPPF